MVKLLLLQSLLLICSIVSGQIVDTYNTDKRHYFVDSKGNIVGRSDYDFTWFDSTDGFGLFQKNGKRGAVDLKGREIIPCEFDQIQSSTNELYLQTVNLINKNQSSVSGIYGLFDKKGNQILPCRYVCMHLYKYGITVQDVNGLWGVFDYNGKPIYEVKYSNFICFDEPDEIESISMGGITRAGYTTTVGGKWGACDRKGNLLVPINYDACILVADNLFAINKGGKYQRYDCVKVDGGKWGLFGNNQEITDFIYDECPKFVNDVATVKVDGEIRMIKNPLKDGSKIRIVENSIKGKKKNNGPIISRYPAPDSDVDKNIPTAKQQAENTFAFIICNENYADAPVPYSLNDGRMFKEYCQKALGLPEKNINMYEDATFGNIITAVEKMKSIADAYDGEASVIFYYAGHGFPDDKQQTAYLLPIDGDASSITTTGYPLAKLYKEISELKLKSSIVFLDACFSGAKREDQMLASSRGVAIKVKDEAPQGNMLVFSAAQGDETAHQLEEMHHGLFTYYLLKGIQNAGGDPDMGTLTEYVTKQVKRQSVVINNKKQTPTIIPSQSLSGNWQTMKLR